MWICEKCNEEIEDNFDSCWNCIKESDVKEEIDRVNSEQPDLNTLIAKESEKDERKVYRTWQKVCFVIFGGGIIFRLIIGGGIDFSSSYALGQTSGPILLWSLILIVVLMFGKK
ncbi:MAG: hypothetical protein HN566_03720 [Polaribacter sp.]|jgi:hypothetical protein|nr:hypothetical protein [Polaribacter sp.]